MTIDGIKSSADLDRALSAYEESSIADFAPTRNTRSINAYESHEIT